MGNDLAGKVYGCLEAEVEAVTALEEVEEEVLFEYNRKRRETGIVKCIQSIPGYEWMYDLPLICDM